MCALTDSCFCFIFPNRTENSIKNRWNCHLKQRIDMYENISMLMESAVPPSVSLTGTVPSGLNTLSLKLQIGKPSDLGTMPDGLPQNGSMLMESAVPSSVSPTGTVPSGVDTLSLKAQIGMPPEMGTMPDGLRQNQICNLTPKPEKARENVPGALSYEPPRLSSSNIQFTWELFDSRNMELEYSPLGIRQMMSAYMYDPYSPYGEMQSPQTFSSPNPSTSSAPQRLGRKRIRGELLFSPQETPSPSKRLCQAVLFSPSQGNPSPGKTQSHGILFSSSVATTSSGEKGSGRILFSSPHRTPSPGKQLCRILFSPSQGNPSPRKKQGREILSPSSEAATSSGRNQSRGVLFSSPQETSSPAKKLCGALLFSPSQGSPSPGKKQGQDALFLDKENCSPYPRCSSKGSVPNRNKELQMFLTALLEEAKKGIEV
jgi:hypothetical protein